MTVTYFWREAFRKAISKFSLIAENFKRVYCLIGKLRGYSLCFFETEERNIGVFAVLGVAAYRLAEGRLVARDIKDIIDYLERYAEIFGIYLRRFELLSSAPAAMQPSWHAHLISSPVLRASTLRKSSTETVLFSFSRSCT